jgi:hypothetical protein
MLLSYLEVDGRLLYVTAPGSSTLPSQDSFRATFTAPSEHVSTVTVARYMKGDYMENGVELLNIVLVSINEEVEESLLD